MKSGLLGLWLLGPLLLIIGGLLFAVTGEMTTVPLVLLWVGLLLMVFYFYFKFSMIIEMLSKRSARYGANLAIVVSVFFVILWLVATMSIKYKWRMDVTPTSRYTLSPQTVKILKGLEEEVNAIAFYRSDERTRQVMYDLLEEYSYYSPNFDFWFVDPDRKPAEAAKYGVTSYRTTLLRSGGKQETLGYESEEKMTNALLKVIREEVKTIYFIKGHGENQIDSGEKEGYKMAKEAIEKENNQVKELLLMGAKVPDDASLVVVSGPEKDLLQSELDSLTKFIKRGGSVLFMLDPAKLTNVTQYLEGYGFKLGADIIIDKMGQLFGTNYLTPVVNDYHKKHPLTREFNLATFFPLAQSVEIEEDKKKGNYTIATTGTESWSVDKISSIDGDEVEFNPKTDRKGPMGLAAVAVVPAEVGVSEKKIGDGAIEESIKKWGRILVIGDSDFANNTNINLAGNSDFFLNVVSWLNQETDLISIRKKPAEITPLTLTVTQGRLVFWLSVIVVPSLIATVGIGVVTRRRLGG